MTYFYFKKDEKIEKKSSNKYGTKRDLELMLKNEVKYQKFYGLCERYYCENYLLFWKESSETLETLHYRRAESQLNKLCDKYLRRYSWNGIELEDGAKSLLLFGNMDMKISQLEKLRDLSLEFLLKNIYRKYWKE